jgi:hypothetical protein
MFSIYCYFKDLEKPVGKGKFRKPLDGYTASKALQAREKFQALLKCKLGYGHRMWMGQLREWASDWRTKEDLWS